MRTTAPPISSSIPAPSAARSGDRIGDGTDGRADAAGVVAGTKAIGVVSCAASRARRASRRQPNTCWGVTPWRRATAETTAPGTRVSSRIAALASADQTRRPLPPVITSRRRGSNLCSSPDTSRSPRSNYGHQHHASPRMTVGGLGRTLTVPPRHPRVFGVHRLLSRHVAPEVTQDPGWAAALAGVTTSCPLAAMRNWPLAEREGRDVEDRGSGCAADGRSAECRDEDTG